jgi:predicted Zn-dependent protease
MAAALLAGALAAQGPDPRLAEAMAHVAAGRFDQAASMLSAIVAERPNDLEAHYRLGLVLLRQNQAARASERLERVVSLGGNIAPVWLALAEARLRLGRHAQALEAAGRAGKLAASDAHLGRAIAIFYVNAAEAALAAGKPEVALGLAGEVVAMPEARSKAALHHVLGKAHRRKNDPAAAAQQFQEAIRLEPANASHYLELAQMFLDHRTPEPAQAILEAALRAIPNDAELWRMLGVAQLGKANTAGAAEAFLRAIDLAPDREDLYASLETLIGEGEPRLAEIAAKVSSFSERRPASPVGWYLRALLAKARASTEDAAALLRKAVEAAPDFWPALYELHYSVQNDPAQALKLLERVVALKPDFAPAHYSLSQLYAASGDRERARRARAAHHEILSRQRVETEKARRSMPRLAYEVALPPAR